MAPKRQKRAAVVNLSEDDSEHAEPRTRGKRVAKKKRQTEEAAPTQEVAAAPCDEAAEAPADGPSGSAPSWRAKKEPEASKERRANEHGTTVAYRPTASQDVKARIQRAMPGSAHRMFLVSTKQLAAAGTEDGPSQEFDVLGATGNVYAVRISRQPHCSCPDFAKGHLCKHILFVMLRVLRQSPQNPVIWQRALLTSEVEGVLSGLTGGAGAGAVDQSVLASDRVRQRYAVLTSADNQNEGEAVFGNGRQRPVEGECPICYDDLVPEGGAAGGSGGAGGRGEAIVFCRTCGNNMHKDCFDRWVTSKRNSGQEVTCVYCRSAWQEERTGADGGEGEGEGGYVNLAQYSDAHRGRGPSLGELYGSNAYFIMANQGNMRRRTAARMHAASRGWS